MPHRYINVSTELGSDFGSPARIERIQQRLKDERGVCRSAQSDFDRHVAEQNVTNLEEALERAEANQAARAEHRTRLAREEAAKVDAHQEQEQATIEAQLRQRYNLALPKPVTDAEWELVRESVLHRYRLQQMDRHDELVADALSRYKF